MYSTHCMESNCSLPCSHQPTACPCPDAHYSSPLFPSYFFQIHLISSTRLRSGLTGGSIPPVLHTKKFCNHKSHQLLSPPRTVTLQQTMAAASNAGSQNSNLITDLDRPIRFQKVEAPRFLQKGSQPYAPAAFIPGNIPSTHFC